jgi:hypothetical protein
VAVRVPVTYATINYCGSPGVYRVWYTGVPDMNKEIPLDPFLHVCQGCQEVHETERVASPEECPECGGNNWII